MTIPSRKPSVQRHLPQNCLEESSRTSGIPCNVAVRFAKRLLVIILNACFSTIFDPDDEKEINNAAPVTTVVLPPSTEMRNAMKTRRYFDAHYNG
ncbi:hypothetical protein TNCV_1946021 [Trichonephila clavipes]|uniref:Uncharacterized protein n=1 Tax=Trichonephila clavipes TaxID=2585209 RepID=A0A8X6V9K2_TRICX|nr:hypothetical protein TNCV_1946021 [Trichonephila clavipes]